MLSLFKKKKKVTLEITFELVPDPEDKAVVWLESPDGLRLKFRDGVYVGWYTPDLEEALG